LLNEDGWIFNRFVNVYVNGQGTSDTWTGWIRL